MGLTLWVYRSLLLAVVVVGAPWWLARMAVSRRYRAGLGGRLGRVPAALRAWAASAQAQEKPVVWLHAVSVGEVLAATRLVARLREEGLAVAVSTTTETGQALARERFGGEAVFYLPLDFAVLMRRYLRVLRPRLAVLMESELWPNMIRECARAGVPLAVANARVSDRSFPRYMRLRRVWGALLREVAVFLAQSEETAWRLLAMGVAAERVVVAGNLKYDLVAPKESRIAQLIQDAAAGRPILVAGSTVDGQPLDEEMIIIQAWEGTGHGKNGVLLVLAPRHPPRFGKVYAVSVKHPTLRATEMSEGKANDSSFSTLPKIDRKEPVEIVVLDTIGDLAAVYGVATVAFVGGSLVARGGHNPLEPAQFGVPVVMGPSYENFREVVEAMRAADAVRIVTAEGFAGELGRLLGDPVEARALGERGRRVVEAQAGATERVVTALLGLVR